MDRTRPHPCWFSRPPRPCSSWPHPSTNRSCGSRSAGRVRGWSHRAGSNDCLRQRSSCRFPRALRRSRPLSYLPNNLRSQSAYSAGGGHDLPARVERIDVVRMSDDRLSDVANWNARRGSTLLRPMMGMAVQDQVRPRIVDRLCQQIAAEEGIDLESLALQRRLDRRVVEQCNPQIGVQVHQSLLEPIRQLLGVTDKGLHLRLAEIAGMGPAKAAPESLGARDADSGAVNVQRYPLTFQDGDANAFQYPAHVILAVGLVVVVAKHGNHRDRHAAQLLGKDPDLFRSAAARQVAGQEQQVGPVWEMLETWPEEVTRAGAVMKVADGRNANHATGSSPSGSLAGTTVVSFTIS